MIKKATQKGLLFLNQDGKDRRMDQDYVLNQDGKDGRIDQDIHFKKKIALSILNEL